MDKREFILLAKALGGSALSVGQLSTLYDTTVGAVPVDTPAPPDTVGISESDKVSAWLTLLRGGTPVQKAQFDTLRTKTFAEQRVAWVAAGSP